MSFFAELNRRNVVRIGIAYVVIGWVLAQVAEFAFENFGAPDWVLKSFVVVLVLGLPLALVFAWVFEMTPEGLKREKDVDRSESITRTTGRKLNQIIIVVLVIAVGLLLADRFFYSTGPATNEITTTEDRRSIAVLPFVNLSDDSDHFADGLSEELLNLLVKSPDLKVAGRTSSFSFKGQNEDLRDIGNALGVQYVLEGSVRRSNDRLRITAQLVKVDDGFHLWSETYDREMADIFDIQDDVASAIADNLRLQLSPKSDRATENAEAYALYLEAVALQSSPEWRDANVVQQLLDQAILLDPAFAHAYELKAINYWNQGGVLIDAHRGQALAYATATKALELDPTLPVARTFAQTAKPDWNWIDELAALEELVRAEPHNVNVMSALVFDLVLAGYSDEAIRVSEQIVEQEPLMFLGYWRKGEALMAAGRLVEARTNLRHAAEIFNSPWAMYLLAVDALLEGNDDEAIEWTEKTRSGSGIGPAQAAAFIRSARDPVDGKVFLNNWVNTTVASAGDIFKKQQAYGWYLAFGHLDEYWEAIDTLSAGVGRGWTNADSLEHIGMVFQRAGTVRHPSYLPHARAQGLPDLWDARGTPDHCTKASGDWVCE